MINKKPWADIKATKEDVQRLWNQFSVIKNRAEQRDFVALAMIDNTYIPLYNDLMNDWDDYHAQMFVYGLTTVLKQSGFI